VDLKKLLKSLTIEEKIGQTLQIAPFFFNRDSEVEIFGNKTNTYLTQEEIFYAGSVLGIGSAEEMIQTQKKYLSKSRHKIPLLFMADIIHGYVTIFPVPIALGCSFNPKLAYEMARISAKEAQTAGIHVTFSPMADLTRDPRWGRVVEGFGEDPYLLQEFIQEIVKGYQGSNLKDEGVLASCVKHFAAYGAAEQGRDYNTVDLSRLSLYQNYLPAYKKAIDSNARLVMTAFNVVDGIPATVNKFLLRDVLRDQWKFDGVTISDYDSLHQIIEHGVAENDREAAVLGLNNGLDIEMASVCYTKHLKSLIKEKLLDEKLLDEAVYRILKLKDDLGLFDNPYKGASIENEIQFIKSKEHLEYAYQAAIESAVLLKNDQILPLNNIQKISIIGPYLTKKRTNGPWSWKGNQTDNSSLLDVFSNNQHELHYSKDCLNISELDDRDLSYLQSSDIIIVAIGEEVKESGEAHSKTDIKIPRNQAKLVELAKSLNKKVLTILYNGRPLDLSDIDNSDAILEAWFLGSLTNEAIYDLIFGKQVPSGKLVMSFPHNVGQIPIYYNQLNTGRPKVKDVHNEYVSYFLDAPNEAKYPFGFGLSYAKFSYTNLKLNKNKFTINQSIDVSIEVYNDSDYDAYEIVQLYIRDYVARFSRPLKELKGFKKVYIKANTKEKVHFTISKNDLTYLDSNGNEVYDYGKFQVMVGPNSVELDKLDFELIKE
jgi:beta-glucosidase